MTPKVNVVCHSGYSYAERPVEVRLDGKRYRVAKILAEGHTPEEKWFRILTPGGRTFTLTYHLADDSWSVRGLVSNDISQ